MCQCALKNEVYNNSCYSYSISGWVFYNLAQHSILHTPEAINFLAISLASSGAWEISAGASEENIYTC